ncbi:MAG TPA: hypothetical protein VHW72_10355, partial [Candidatus Angelobacter sp.]|nr:hypothetical protein [Candidatus Angelobacter sp.]
DRKLTMAPGCVETGQRLEQEATPEVLRYAQDFGRRLPLRSRLLIASSLERSDKIKDLTRGQLER